MRVLGLKLPRDRYLWISLMLIVASVASIPSLFPGHHGDVSHFERIQRGDGRQRVRTLLGPPMAVETATYPEHHLWGPQEALASIIGPGSPYEEWRWEDENRVYYVWLAGPEGGPVDEWGVVCTGSYPHGAVFEPHAP